MCDSANAYSKEIDITNNNANLQAGIITAVVGSNTLTFAVANSATGTLAEANTRMAAVLSELTVGDIIEVGNNSIGKQYLKITSLPAAMGTNSSFANATYRFFTANTESVYQLSIDYQAGVFTRYWEYFNNVDSAPGISTFQSSQRNQSSVS